MLSKTNSLFVLTVIILAGFSFAQETQSVPVIEPASKTQQPTVVSFPYTAEINADSVYIRAGNGTIYYKCGKLNKADKITVVGSEYGWAKIIPPKGSFSWISKDFVTPDAANPQIGNVTGDSVRIWAGSEDLGPLRSSGYQTKLNTGDKVELLGTESSGYYMIVPPEGAYLWVSSQYVKYAGDSAKESPQTPIRTVEENIENNVLPPKKAPDNVTKDTITKDTITKDTIAKDTVNTDIAVEKKPPVAVRPSAEIKRLSECRELGKLIDEQREKPADEQDYGKIKTVIAAIINDPDAGKAKLYAEYLSNLIDRVELAIVAKNELEKQDAELAEATRKIKERLTAELQNISTSTQFTVTGIVKESQIFTAEYGNKRYKVVAEDTGKIRCYAVPADAAAQANLENSINKKVSLGGEVIKNPYSAIMLIRVSDIYDPALPPE